MRLNEKGFTLLEIMIVVAILGLIASIAIPNMLRARMNANESNIKKDLRIFSTANETYRTAQNPPVYSPNVAVMTTAVPNYLDTTWTANPRHFYTFTYVVAGDQSTYSMVAVPVAGGGINTFCIDSSGIMTGSVDGIGPPAGAVTGCVGGTVMV